jgi:NADH-quinone oxidoreductase subunit J
MHSEVQQDHPGTCPKCGMSLVPKQEVSSDAPQADEHHEPHGDHAQEHRDMPGMEMSRSDQMGMSGMSARQHYEMMVEMAMSTAQLPWALVLGALSALLLIVLVVITPWPQSHLLPTQDATTMVGELLLSRYMIAFEGAAFLILAGIAGAVILGKRERFQEISRKQQPAVETSGKQEEQNYTCPMHPDV